MQARTKIVKLAEKLREAIAHEFASEVSLAIIQQASGFLEGLDMAIRRADRIIAGSMPVGDWAEQFAQVPLVQARAALQGLTRTLNAIAAAKASARQLGLQ